jgi:DNA-binding NarL/FixJ family response regulator
LYRVQQALGMRHEARHAPTPIRVTKPTQPDRGGGTRIALILFVEYHAALRQSASYLMDQEDDLKVVAQAGSVAEGRDRMAEGGIDAAIVDIPLPDEGAEAMVRDLHQANPSIPVLAMTTIEDHRVHERFLEAGANEVLDKGIPLAQILAAVRRLGGEG